MRHDPRRPNRGHGGGDPERSLLFAVRCALLPTLCLPVGLASVAASSSGTGVAPAMAIPLAALAVIVNVVCWRRVIVRWRALPDRRDDDDHGWPRRGWDADDPLAPSGGPGGITFDWPEFERAFWIHVGELERQRELDVVGA
jgi:hypothetical protein